MKKIGFILIIICILISVIVVWQYKNNPAEEEFFSAPEAQEAQEALPKEETLKKTEKYGIFGDDEFDTIVLGYLEIKEVEDYQVGKHLNAYFAITDFSDEGFRESIKAGIERGNTVNFKKDGMYKFNLGCFKNEAILGVEHDENEHYINNETQEAIINSSLEKPISVILSFGEHLGMGCTCCNLAHKVRIEK